MLRAVICAVPTRMPNVSNLLIELCVYVRIIVSTFAQSPAFQTFICEDRGLAGGDCQRTSNSDLRRMLFIIIRTLPNECA